MGNKRFSTRRCRSCGRVGVFAAALLMLTFLFAVKPGSAEQAGANRSNGGSEETHSSEKNDTTDDVSFPTFYKSGLEVCTDDEGKPVIMLFSSSTCSHCEWGGEIFDFIVKYYVATGRIEAYHYDVNTGDDLLTEETETRIQPEHLQLKEHGDPEGLVPYYNFGCKYERIGNGYERVDDSVGEAAEMRQVIETLIQMPSDSDRL